jgi:hypothetical protein
MDNTGGSGVVAAAAQHHESRGKPAAALGLQCKDRGSQEGKVDIKTAFKIHLADRKRIPPCYLRTKKTAPCLSVPRNLHAFTITRAQETVNKLRG